MDTKKKLRVSHCNLKLRAAFVRRELGPHFYLNVPKYALKAVLVISVYLVCTMDVYVCVYKAGHNRCTRRFFICCFDFAVMRFQLNCKLNSYNR